MKMTPGIRKFALTVHVSTSVGLLGSISAFLVLALSGLNAQETQAIRAAYLGMDLLARFIIVPLAFASIATGVIQSLGTPWGLFRHYWVVIKLLLAAFATTILLIKLKLIGHAASLASAAMLPRAELRTVGMELAVHAAGGLLVLFVPMVLSVYKPQGLTPFGMRKQQEQRGRSEQPRQSLPRTGGSAGVSSDGTITFTLRRMQILVFAAIVLVLHIFILHVTGAGLVGH
jgi:hypothetical protein